MRKKQPWAQLFGLFLFLALVGFGVRVSGCVHSQTHGTKPPTRTAPLVRRSAPPTQARTKRLPTTKPKITGKRPSSEPKGKKEKKRPLPPQATPASVFHIKRNKNRNEVHYGVRLDKACKPVGKKPVYPYWRTLEKGPNVREKLQLFEHIAYGISSQRVKGEKITIRLKPLRSRSIEIVTRSKDGTCQAFAYAVIAKLRVRLRSIYVFAVPSFPFPRVKYIKLFGVNQENKPILEKIKK